VSAWRQVIVRFTVTYQRLDGMAVTLPSFTIFSECDALIVEYDSSPMPPR
jgi:hypothetical protein